MSMSPESLISATLPNFGSCMGLALTDRSQYGDEFDQGIDCGSKNSVSPEYHDLFLSHSRDFLSHMRLVCVQLNRSDAVDDFGHYSNALINDFGLRLTVVQKQLKQFSCHVSISRKRPQMRARARHIPTGATAMRMISGVSLIPSESGNLLRFQREQNIRAAK